jgi:hypothetical protein
LSNYIFSTIPLFTCSTALSAEGQLEAGDSKPKNPSTETLQKPHNNDTESSQVQTGTDLKNRTAEQFLTDSIQNHNTSLHKKYAICMHQNNVSLENLSADLAQIVLAWPDLPENIQKTIKLLVKACLGARVSAKSLSPRL